MYFLYAKKKPTTSLTIFLEFTIYVKIQLFRSGVSCQASTRERFVEINLSFDYEIQSDRESAQPSLVHVSVPCVYFQALSQILMKNYPWCFVHGTLFLITSRRLSHVYMEKKQHPLDYVGSKGAWRYIHCILGAPYKQAFTSGGVIFDCTTATWQFHYDPCSCVNICAEDALNIQL